MHRALVRDQHAGGPLLTLAIPELQIELQTKAWVQA